MNSQDPRFEFLGSSDAQRLCQGDRRLLARTITGLENGDPAALALVDQLSARLGRSWRVGITGPPGAGKSTLIGELIKVLRDRHQTVAVVAVDPSSPFTGGALLGDRVRMPVLVGDSGVFIRSLASRGALGGLAAAADDVADLLDATGFDVVILETVGVGQSEVAIAASADTVVVVVHPESGDGIQALKAGLMEIAQVVAINKADRLGADALQKDLEHALMVSGRLPLKGHDPAPGIWPVPIVRTVATHGDGIAALWDAIQQHRQWRTGQPQLPTPRRARLEQRLRNLLTRKWLAHLQAHPAFAPAFATAVAQLESGAKSPLAAVDDVFAALGLGK